MVYYSSGLVFMAEVSVYILPGKRCNELHACLGYCNLVNGVYVFRIKVLYVTTFHGESITK